MLVSVVIPVRRDAAALERLLHQLQPAPRVELIVAAAAFDDATRELRDRRSDVRWIESVEGRGVQLNAGAAVASGEWLWFVHADSLLPDGWREAFVDLSTAPAIVGGSFRFALASSAWQARLLERAVVWRVRWLSLPYGDQGIFARRTVFESIGGFRPLPLMEDVEFIRRLTRQGRLRHLTLKLTTSARRWEHEGWFRRSAANLALLGMYAVGVSPQRLARRYDGSRRRPAAPRPSDADQESG